MKLKQILYFVITLLCLNTVNAQLQITSPDNDQANPLPCNLYTNPLTTNFFDSGNTGGAYSPNENETIVICPDLTNGSKISTSFGTTAFFPFDIDPSDTLFIYDGPDATAPQVAALNNNTIGAGFSFTASFNNNPTGCLTFVFVSDGANEGDGWQANITCNNPAQPFDVDAEAYLNGEGPDIFDSLSTNYIDACIYDFILFIAKPTFPNAEEVTGTGYSQTLENVEYEWLFSDGTILDDNDTVMFFPPDHAGFNLDLTVTDTHPLSVTISEKIRIATKPIYAPSSILDDSICLGDQSVLSVSNPFYPEGLFNTNLSFTHGSSMLIPDGTGVDYTTSIPVTGYGAATIIDENSINEICLEIEHSDISNLEILIECPDGNQVVIMNANNASGGLVPGGFGGNGIQMGDPATINGAVGMPFEYCFSTSALNQSIANETGNVSPAPTNGLPSLIEDSYQPEGSFNGFTGCTVDGDWDLIIRDNNNTGSNDGFVIDWSIQFDESINPNAETYQNTQQFGHWVDDPTILSQTPDSLSATVQPTMTGLNPYTYETIDDFNCVDDTTLQLYVIEEPIIFEDTLLCDDTLIVANTFSVGGGYWTSTDPTNVTFNDSTLENPEIYFATTGLFTLYFTDSLCMYVDSAVVNHGFHPSIFADTNVCADTFQVVGTESYQGGIWSITGGLTISDLSDNPQFFTAVIGQSYDATYIDNFCKDTLTSTINIFPDISVPGDSELCNDSTQLVVTGSTSGGIWSSDSTQIIFSNSTVNNPTVSTTEFGEFPILYYDNTCGTTDTINVTFASEPITNFIDTTTCDGIYQVTGVSSYDGGTWNNPSPTDVTITTETDDNPLINVLNPGVYTLTYTDNQCGISDNIEITYLDNPEITGTDTICALSTTLGLQNSYVDGGVWSSDTPADISFDDATLDNVNVTSTTFGTYYIYYSENYCGKQDSIQLTFAADPITNLLDSTLCSSDYQVNGVSSLTGGVWNSLDTEITITSDTDENPLISLSTPGIYTITYTDNTCGISDNIELTLLPEPNITGEDTTCTLTLNLSEGTTYPNGGTWSTNSPTEISFDNTTTNDVTVTSTSIGTYMVYYTETYCGGIDSLEITFAPSPITNFMDTSLCIGSLQIEDVTSFVGGTWTTSDPTEVTFDDENTENPLISIATPGFYTVTFTDNQCGVSDLMNIEFLSQPDILQNSGIICTSPLEVSFSNLYPNGGEWSSNNSAVVSFDDNEANPTNANISNDGTYTIYFTENVCSFIDSIEVTLASPPELETIDTLLCVDSLVVSGTQSFAGGIWSVSPTPGATINDVNSANPQFDFQEYGTFTFTYTDNQCNVSVDYTVDFTGFPQGYLPADTSTCAEAPPIAIEVMGDFNVDSYLWEDGTVGPFNTMDNEGVYALDITNACGTNTIYTALTYDFCGLTIPNVFTPNGDGANDNFIVLGTDIKEYEISIVNRWGNKVFVSTDINEQWNGFNKQTGKLCSDGTYFYTVRFIKNDNFSDEAIQQGFIELKGGQ